MSKPIRILYIDDNPLDRELARDVLEKEHGGFELVTTASRADFETALAKGGFDLVLSDFNILGFEGLQVLEAVHARDEKMPVIIVTGTGSEEIAVEALKRGAADYVIKTPKHILRLPLTIHAVLEKKHLKEDRDRLFNLSLDLLCVAGFDGYFKQLNPAWEKTLGWSNKELLSKPYLDFVHPDDREATSHATAILIDGQLVYFFENRYLCKDGAYKWISWNSYPLVEEELIFAVARDITERKRAEERLAYQAKLLANVNDAVIASDENFVLTAWNKAAERIYGWTAEEVIGKSGTEILQTEFLTISRPKAIKQLIESGEYFAEVINPRKDGTKIYIETQTTALRDPNGKTVGYVSINRDISERKRAEEALRESGQRFATLFERSAFVAVLSSLPNGIILNVNMAFEQVFGFTKEEAIGRTTLELGINPDAAGRQRVLAQLKAQGSARDIELELRTKSGEARAFTVNMDLIDIGDEKYILNTMQDITERKRAEEELHLHSGRLAELSRQLVETHETESRAIGRELHDQIGQILTALKLTMEIAVQLPPELREKKHAQAQELVDDLLARVSNLSLQLRPPMLDDLGLVPALLWHINRFQEQSGVAAEFKHSGVDGVRFDPQIETTVYRIIQETLTNVARHAHATLVRLEIHASIAHIEIQVEDNGQGFDPKTASAKNRGLSGMRERASLIGGTFQIESQIGKGTKKIIQLPLRENTA